MQRFRSRKMTDDELISIMELKRTAQRLLPNTSYLRNIILAEPDTLSRSDALAKITVFSRLLEQELGSS